MKPIVWMVVGGGVALGGVGLVRWMLTPAAGGPYKPNSSEVPIRQDFDGTAEKVVRPDNYKAQLTKIEDQLTQQSRSDQVRTGAH